MYVDKIVLNYLQEAIDRQDWSIVIRLSESLSDEPVEDKQEVIRSSERRGWPISMVKAIYKRDEGHCVYCGGYATDIDHVVPVSWRGPTTRNNGVCACSRCNSKKSNKADRVDMITRGIFWLLQHGEDMSWTDSFEPGYRSKLKPTLKHCGGV
jgi:hypothetical protein